eukprot:TRINITY_DN2768_c2_g1_i2.p1 TRINITY_DN2768_c2_g1~~TRINITY_DN2768_c2_g1_i2.p1  ORF type:complete len:144 (+),score=65.02 TRINITY_DN2768_c2_g1_i2:281-712(+)
MGMSDAFSRENNPFALLSEPGDLFVNGISHKTMLEVDEKGTTAAAATAMSLSKSRGPQSVKMRVDRPFILMIREEKSGFDLFCGVIEQLEGKSVTESKSPQMISKKHEADSKEEEDGEEEEEEKKENPNSKGKKREKEKCLVQ